MIGLFFLFILVVYIAAAIFTAKRLQSKAAKYIAIAIYALIPTWDILPGYIYFRYLCETEGGNKIYRSVDDVEGFFSTGYPLGNREDAFTKYGYKTMERGNQQLGFYRYWLGQDGRVHEEKIKEPVSRYALREEKKLRPWNVQQNDYVIFDIKTNEIVAKSTLFKYIGSWIMTKPGELVPTGGRPGIWKSCHNYSSEMWKDFFVKTLKPTR